MTALSMNMLYHKEHRCDSSSPLSRRTLLFCALIALYLSWQDPPMVLPMYHIGMHQVAPETPVHKRGRGKLSKTFPNVGEKRHLSCLDGDRLLILPIWLLGADRFIFGKAPFR